MAHDTGSVLPVPDNAILCCATKHQQPVAEPAAGYVFDALKILSIDSSIILSNSSLL